MQNLLAKIFMIFLAVFFGSSASARDENVLQFEQAPFCSKISSSHFLRSVHPNGNPYGTFQENNVGVEIKCYPYTTDKFYFIVAGLTNSRDGNTFAAGAGLRINIAKYKRWAVYIGAEILGLEYVDPGKNKKYHGFLPTQVLGAEYRLKDNDHRVRRSVGVSFRRLGNSQGPLLQSGDAQIQYKLQFYDIEELFGFKSRY
jgi:hypothetical protein